jgi:hypothetical protein
MRRRADIEQDIIDRLRGYDEHEGTTVMDGITRLLSELFERVEVLEEKAGKQDNKKEVAGG